MFKTFTTFLRGRQAEAREAFIDANALTLIDQYLRDAGQDLERARRALAIARSEETMEADRMARLKTGIDDLEARALAALSGGREDLAEQAATAIADLESELAASQEAQAKFRAATARLERQVSAAERRFTEMDRGRRTARVSESVRRLRAPATINGAQSGALSDAEATLKRLRQRQMEDEALHAAEDATLAATGAQSIAARLEEAGFGPATRSTARSVLDRLKARQSGDAASH